MIHQLRLYEIFERNKAAFHARFRDHALRIMKRHGFHLLAAWETKSATRAEFAFLLAWPDLETKVACWNSFCADEEWLGIKRTTAAEHGELIGAIEDRLLTPTEYSPRL